MPGREHGALHDQDVRARALDHLHALLGASGNARYRAWNSRVLYRLDALADQLRLDRLAINLLEQGVDAGLVRLRNLLDDRFRVLVTRVHAIEVQHADAAELAHRDRELDVDDSVHRRGPEGKGELETVTAGKRGGDVDLVGV